MIYLLYGENGEERKKVVNETVNSLAQTENSFVSRFDETNWSTHTILSYAESAGLFGTNYIVIIDRIFNDEEKLNFIISNLSIFAESANHFIFSENKILKETLKNFEKHNSKIEYFSSIKKEKESTNHFALADAFAKKDKKTAWLLYVKAIEGGEAPESITGMLFWKIKTMILSGRITPFKKEEINQISSTIVSIYHKARSDGTDLTISLEQFILKSL